MFPGATQVSVVHDAWSTINDVHAECTEGWTSVTVHPRGSEVLSEESIFISNFLDSADYLILFHHTFSVWSTGAKCIILLDV